MVFGAVFAAHQPPGQSFVFQQASPMPLRPALTVFSFHGFGLLECLLTISRLSSCVPFAGDGHGLDRAWLLPSGQVEPGGPVCGVGGVRASAP